MTEKTYALKANVTSVTLTFPDGRSRLLTEGNTIKTANAGEQQLLDEHPGLKAADAPAKDKD